MLTKDDYIKIKNILLEKLRYIEFDYDYTNSYESIKYLKEVKELKDLIKNVDNILYRLELFYNVHYTPDTNIHLKDFRATTRNIDILEINLGIRLKDFQYMYLRGYKQAINGDLKRGSGKTYVRTLAYTLGLIDKKELFRKELTHDSVVKNVNTINYLINLNNDFIDKLRDIEVRDYYLHQLKDGECSCI